MENFFDNPTTLRDPEHFVGREEQLKRIFGLLKARQSISLVGPRRFGKTSLLTCLRSSEIQQKFNFDGSRFLFLYLDLQKRSMKVRVDFFDEVHRTLKEQSQHLGYTVTEGFDKDDEFDALLDEFQQHHLHPVLMMDAFDEIMQYQPINENGLGFLRSEGSEGKISYITSSMEQLVPIFRELLPGNAKIGSSPFYNIFATIRLTPFSVQEAQTLLINTSTRGGLPFRDEETHWVLRMAGRHPFWLQQVAALVFEEKRAREEGKRVRELENSDFARIQKEVQQNLFSHFEDWWTMLSDDDHQRVSKSILQLEEDNHTYPELCYSELFDDYLRKTGMLLATLPHINADEISVDEYKLTLKNLNNPGELGESVLISIPFIKARIEKQKAISPAMRGKILQDILKEALESMGGQGQRADGRRDWVYYNILYYRYFMLRHDMSQDMIADRLGISQRQYYRLFPTALEQLRNALLGMDASAALQDDV